MEKENFEYTTLDKRKRTITIKEDSFNFTQKDKKINDVKFQTKPTTFFKDAMRRFVKNKSSVAGGIILGVLTLMAFILPLAIPYDVDTPHNGEIELPSKLFKSGTGWWDGTKSYKNIVYDQDNQTPTGFSSDAIVDGTLKTKSTFTNDVNAYAKGGYVHFWESKQNDVNVIKEPFFSSSAYDYDLSFDYNFTYEILPYEEYLSSHKKTFAAGIDDKNYIMSQYKIELSYFDDSDVQQSLLLKDYSCDGGLININLKDNVQQAGITSLTSLNNAKLSFVIKSSKEKDTGILIKKVTVEKSKDGVSIEDAALSKLCIADANKTLSITDTKDASFWVSNGIKSLYKADIQICSFKYDKYLAAYGEEKNFKFGGSEIEEYVSKGWLKYDFNVGISSFEILNDRCPIRSAEKQEVISKKGVTVSYVYGTKSKYRYLGYEKMPSFLFGTDSSGNDLLKVVFTGLRTSLLLGVITFIVCFTFGLIWGSISGYFGGTVDLVMERFCDILGGIPWIVLMTLIIIKWGSSFFTFAVALCLTDWMGTAARTRTQFYRFKGREYILASRTLGSSDTRLIFKHILPNSMGTIITSSVLMIPGVIFSEATIAYLNLGLQGMKSLGVTLSQNQKYISTNPTLIILPSIVMALIMISFNLFGNGLRDAFNPSLKGSE